MGEGATVWLTDDKQSGVLAGLYAYNTFVTSGLVPRYCFRAA